MSDQQIDMYLASLGNDLQGVRQGMASDPELQKIAETPLMLSIMTLAFHGMAVEDLPPLDTAEAQRQRLFESYTERMFARREDTDYSPQQAIHYLKCRQGVWLNANNQCSISRICKSIGLPGIYHNDFSALLDEHRLDLDGC